MKSWFGRPSLADAPGKTLDEREAYEEGRVDESRRVMPAGDDRPVQPVVDRAALREAYDQGRRDDRSRRRGSGWMTLIVVMALVIAGVLLYLAVENGSFSRGGAVVDQALGNAAAPVRGAADKAGNALQDAGRSLKQTAGDPSN